jgi:hypothetical protein
VARKYKLCVSFDANKSVSIANLGIVYAFAKSGIFFHFHEGPNLIGFNVLNRDAFDLRVHNALALLARDHEQIQDPSFDAPR